MGLKLESSSSKSAESCASPKSYARIHSSQDLAQLRKHALRQTNQTNKHNRRYSEFAKTQTTMRMRTVGDSELRNLGLLFLGAAALLLGLFLIPSLASAAMSEDQERFEVERIKGDKAWFNTTRDPSKRKLEKGKVLTVGDTIFTKEKTTVRISLPDGSMIKIGANTTFKITEVEGSRNLWQWTFQLLNGTVRALIKKATTNLGNKSKVRIKTPAGTAGVRGTDYVVSYSPDTKEVNVRVNEGSVWLAPPEAKTFDENNVGTELLIKGYCSKAKVGQPAEPAKSCSKSAIPDVDESGVYDGKMEVGPSRLPQREIKVSGPGGETLDLQKTRAAEGKGVGGQDTQGMNEGGIGKTKEFDPNKARPAKKVSVEKLSAVLIQAVKMGDKSSAVGAIDLGAYVDVQDDSGNTPLMYAAMKGHDVLVLALITAGASINMQNRDGFTALMFAAHSGTVNTVTTLKLGSPNTHLINKYGETAEDIARKRKGKTGKLIHNELRRWRNGEITAILKGKQWARLSLHEPFLKAANV